MPSDLFHTLTPAECAVLRIALGRTNDQIGHMLAISPQTVAVHIKSARRKTKLASKGDVARAFQAWEASTQKMGTHFLPIADQPLPAHDAIADREPLQEEGTPFLFTMPTRPVPSVKPDREQHSRYHPHLTLVLVLASAALLLACLNFLPGLATTAQMVGNMLKPIHR